MHINNINITSDNLHININMYEHADENNCLNLESTTIGQAGTSNLRSPLSLFRVSSFAQIKALIAEHLSVRQLILLCVSFCVCMYVCVCPSCLGMLIFCTRYTPAVLSSVRLASLLLLAGPVQLHEFGL